MITRGVPNLHPSSEYFYKLDWAAALADGITISAVSWTVPAGLQNLAESQSGTITGVKLADDGATLGQTYDVVCEITTSTDEDLNQVLRITVGYDGS